MGKRRLRIGKRVTDEENLISLELKTIEESFLAVEVSKDDIEEVIARWTGIPVQSIKQEEASKALKYRREIAREYYFSA